MAYYLPSNILELSVLILVAKIPKILAKSRVIKLFSQVN